MEKLAKFFMAMCIGEYSGHMSMIPHNPTMHALMKGIMDEVPPFGDTTQEQVFANALRKLADALDPKQEPKP